MSTGLEVLDTERAVPSAASMVTFGFAALNESDAEFDKRMDQLARAITRVERMKLTIFEEGVDYGVIPGTQKPTLLLPGAQKICRVLGLVPTFTVARTVGDGATSPHIHYALTCHLHVGSADGPVVGEGVGSTNSWEKKYRYRRGERICPACGKPAIRKSKFPDRKTGDVGWYCYDKAGGCGANYMSTDESITGQVVGDVENPDPYDQDNTFLKIAKKRSFVDAALTVSMSSGTFTQDLEDTAEAAMQGRERDRLKQELGALLRENGVTKNAEMVALVERLTGKKLAHPKEIDGLTLIELRTLTQGAREFFGETVKEPKDAEATA